MSDSLDPKVAELVDAWSAECREARVSDIEAFLARTKSAVHFPQQRPYSRMGVQIWLAGSVAVLALLAYVGTLGKTSKSGTANREMVAQVTRNAQRARLTLSDGSTLMLAPSTTVRYSSDFGKNGQAREIFVDGEAFFTVVHNEGAPFIVRAGNSQLRVVGTSFAVRKYSDDKSVRFVVAQGKVAVKAGAGPVSIVSSGDIGVADANGVIAVSRDTSIANAIAWTTDQLVLEEVSLAQAIPELERWYDIKVHASASLLNKKFIITLQRQTAQEAVGLIAPLIGASVHMTGNVATFTPQP